MLSSAMRIGRAIACLLVAAQGACAPRATPCPLSGQTSMTEVDLYFGRAIAGRQPVTDAEWSDFASGMIAPRFPDGFTVMDAQGTWLSPTTHIGGHEATKFVRILVFPDKGLGDRIQAVSEAYKQRFRQEAVGIVTSPACAVF